MQIFQSTSNQNTFKFNGLTYPKNFMVIKQGAENIAFHNAYDSAVQLMGSTNYSNIQVDGVIYDSQADLMASLATLLFAKSFNYVVQDNNATRLVSVGDIILSGNSLTIEPAEWLINSIEFDTDSNTVLTVPFAISGLTRIDIIVGTDAGLIIRIAGNETAGIAVAPITPIDAVYISQLTVSDNTIGEPSTPITGGLYVQKVEFAENYIEDSGSVTLNLIEDKTAFRILNGDVEIIRGFEANDYFLDTVYYVGKEIKIANSQETSFILQHNEGAIEIPMIFPDGNDLILAPNEVAIFKLTKTTDVVAEFISLNRVVSSNYLPLSGGTVTGATTFTSGLTANMIYSSGGLSVSAGDGTGSNWNSSYFDMYPADGGVITNFGSTNFFVGIGNDGTTMNPSNFFVQHYSGSTSTYWDSVVRAFGLSQVNSFYFPEKSNGYVGTFAMVDDISGYTPSLQQVYYSSATGQIITTDTKPISLKPTTSNNDIVFEVRDLANAQKVYIDGNGNILGNVHYGFAFALQANGGYLGDPSGTVLFKPMIELGLGRWDSNQKINYLGDYSSQFSNLSLIHRGYGDSHYLNLLSGGTITGSTRFTNGLTANTISATTYNGLPIDIYTTGGTYSAGTTVLRNNTGGTFSISGFTTPFTGGAVTGATIFTNGLTANSISATSISILSGDVQTQLNGKVSKSQILTAGYQSITGYATATTLLSLLVPAGTFASGDTLSFTLSGWKSITALGIDYRIYHDTSNGGITNAFATNLGVGASSRVNSFVREAVIDGTTLRNTLAAGSTATTPYANTGLSSTTTFNPAVDNWFTVQVTPSVVSEVIGIFYFTIKKTN